MAPDKSINNEISIKARARRVWNILTDIKAYSEWNPYIREARGEVNFGEKLRLFFRPPSGIVFTARPRINKLVKDREFGWAGRFLVPGLLDSEHVFILKQERRSLRLIQEEKYKGILLPIFRKRIEQKNVEGFREMNKAIKNLAERKEELAE